MVKSYFASMRSEGAPEFTQNAAKLARPDSWVLIGTGSLPFTETALFENVPQPFHQ